MFASNDCLLESMRRRTFVPNYIFDNFFPTYSSPDLNVVTVTTSSALCTGTWGMIRSSARCFSN